MKNLIIEILVSFTFYIGAAFLLDTKTYWGVFLLIVGHRLQVFMGENLK